MKLDLAAQEIKNSYPAASDFYFFPASSDFFVDAYGYQAQILIKLPCLILEILLLPGFSKSGDIDYFVLGNEAGRVWMLSPVGALSDFRENFLPDQ